MKFRIAIDVADAPGLPDAAAVQVMQALARFAHAINYGGCLPTAPVPLWCEGKIVGCAWTELEEEPADGAVPGL